MEIRDWTINYVKNKDIWHKKLQDYTERNGVIEFKFKDKTHDYMSKENLDETILKADSKADAFTIVCPALESNFNFLIKHWEELKNNTKLSIIFVDLKKNEKWVINPYTHSLIADPESLELGLKSMFQQIS